MTFSAKHHRKTPRPALFVTAATFLLPLVIGCASPGPPHPPSLHLPEIVTDLTAQRIGDSVQLHWTTPSNTTDGIAVPTNLTAHLCRQLNPTAHGNECTPLPAFAVRPGPSQTLDHLPANLTTDPLTLLAYHIEILNPAGHSAGPSQPAFTVAGAAPPQVDRLRAIPARIGATIEWQQATNPVPVELHRILLPNPNAPKAPPKPQPKPQPKSEAKPDAKSGPKLPLQFTAQTPAQVRLLAASQHADPGGTHDTTALKGETYTYTAQRVRTVTLDGHTIELRSPISSPVTLQITDIFPPSTPIGLAAIPSAHSIDLSWQPSPDPDLVGYHVYRREPSSSQFTRLTTTPLVGPGFSDQTAQPGNTYVYRVTAIDATGNESPPSTEVQETLREP